MADAKAVTRQDGVFQQVGNTDALIVGDEIKNEAGSTNNITMSSDGGSIVIDDTLQVTAGNNLNFDGANLDFDPTGTVDFSMDAAQTFQITLADTVAVDAFLVQDSFKKYISVNTDDQEIRINTDGGTYLESGGLYVSASGFGFTGQGFDLDPTGNFTCDMDAGFTVDFLLADNQDDAFLVHAPGAGVRNYLALITTTGSEAVELCNATNNPDLTQLGSGQVSFAGNVNATAGLDVTGADLTAVDAVLSGVLKGTDDGTGLIVGHAGTGAGEGSCLQLASLDAAAIGYLVDAEGMVVLNEDLSLLQAYYDGAWNTLASTAINGTTSNSFKINKDSLWSVDEDASLSFDSADGTSAFTGSWILNASTDPPILEYYHTKGAALQNPHIAIGKIGGSGVNNLIAKLQFNGTTAGGAAIGSEIWYRGDTDSQHLGVGATYVSSDVKLNAIAGLEVSGTTFTVTGVAITQTGAGQVTFAGNVAANGGLNVDGAELIIEDGADNLVFASAVTSPEIYQQNTAAASDNLLIRAQTSTGIVLGGDLLLSSGGGGLAPGNVRLQSNLTDVLRVDLASLSFYPGTAAPSIYQQTTTTANGENLDISAQSSSFAGSSGGNLVLSAGQGVASDGVVAIAVNATGTLLIDDDSISFLEAVTTPTIKQESTTVGDGENFSIEAQSSSAAASVGGGVTITGGAGVTLGGNVTLDAGDGATDGVILFSRGGTPICYIQTNVLTFQSAQTAPYIGQDDTASGDGADFTYSAQTTTQAGQTGGDIRLEPGTGPLGNGNVIVSNKAGTAAQDVIPVVDNTGYLGTASKRWSHLYVETVVQGDTAFTDTHCPKCSRPLSVGDSLELYVHACENDEGRQVLKTVPAHRSCFISRIRSWFK